jgi:cation diffusion facilitator CzcD-associated flavoprotein CzcO
MTDATEQPVGSDSTVERYDALVIGAGFSGMYMLHRLRELGRSAVLLEAGSGVGGTWYWNRYPGARCDSESYYYSYSFSDEVQQQWQWTERYAGHAEIRGYLDHIADRFDLRRDIAFDTRVTGARFDAEQNSWTVLTNTGATYSAQFLIAAVGCLSSANIPNIPGLDQFEGDWYHTGQWPHGDVDFSEKHVGIIGTGSTGIQAIPVIASTAEHLTVFQRTPNYSIPARNRPLGEDESAEIKRRYSQIRAVQRSSTNGHPWFNADEPALSVSAEERWARYEAAWEVGGLRLRSTFQDLLADVDANATVSEFIRDKIRQVVTDPVTAEQLIPYDHPFATKRPPIDTEYFETYNRPNVSLVDLRSTPIEAIYSHGVQTSDAQHELDIIVFATGFDAMTGPLLALNLDNGAGETLRQSWAEGPRSYLGLQIAGFPNLFTITGPGSPSVLANMPTAIEQHVDWICDCLEYMRVNGLVRVEASESAEKSWGIEVQAAARRTLLPMATSSWYLGANVPGKPRVFMPYAGGLANYFHDCAAIADDEYTGFVFV